MKSIKIWTVALSIFAICGTPAFAKIEAGVSQNHFYDSENTIMTEALSDKNFRTEEYWGKNLFYFNKYRPLFMLSNKELYNLAPKENTTITQRVSAPAVYNISLKTSSIKTVSFSQVQPKYQKVQKKIKPVLPEQVTSLYPHYEMAKNPNVDSDGKLEVVSLLINSKKTVNYDLALDLLNDVVVSEPYNAHAYCLKGEIYRLKKDPKNSMKSYIEALKINPASKQGCLGIAKLLEESNKELSKKYYERAMLLSQK